MSWIDKEGSFDDVIISSRVRLARNIAHVPFPPAMDIKTVQEAIGKVRGSIMDSNSALKDKFKFVNMKEISLNDRNVLIERHLISPDLANNPDVSAVLLDENEEISIMINEEDHIRMQCILPGYQLQQAWETIDKVDDLIEESIEYSYDEQLGYLTCCPTNVGTGMRASLMMHLPALVYAGGINPILQTISKIGLTARGLYGEGSEAFGNIYQISNQVTLGPSEYEIINNIGIVAKQIMEKEKAARKAFADNNRLEFEDNIWRSFGILCYAKKIDIKEFMALISQVRLGISMGIINNMAIKDVDRIMVLAQPSSLQKYLGERSGTQDLDVLRADLVKDILNK